MHIEEKIFTVPLHDTEFLGCILDAVPDDWSGMSGWLEAPPGDRVARDTGYSYSSATGGIRLEARATNPPREIPGDPLAILIENKLPGFISFNRVGYWSRNEEFRLAKRLAASFVRRGYSGWLQFDFSRSKHMNQRSAWLRLELQGWRPTAAPRSNKRPPSAILGYNLSLGGSLENLAPLLRVCQSQVFN